MKLFNVSTKTKIKVEGNGYLYAGNFQAIINRKVSEIFPPFCEKFIKPAIAERPDDDYVLNVDGVVKEKADLSQLQNAKRKVIFTFIDLVFDVAVAEFANILKVYYKQRGARMKFFPGNGSGLIAGSTDPRILMFYGGRGKVDRLITSRNDIESFEPGDYILITSDNPWQVYLNTKGKAKNSLRVKPLQKNIAGFRGGFFGLAARRIRQKLGIQAKRNQSQAPIWVGAVRSRAVLEHIGPPPQLSGEALENWNELQYLGAWAIMIRRIDRRSNRLGL